MLGLHKKTNLMRWGVTAIVLGALVGAIFGYVVPVSYESSLSFTVNQINKQQTQDYQFDGYYAIQASDLFSDTIVSWFQTPSFLLEIYTRAGVDPMITSLDGFTGRFAMKKFSAQNLVLKFSVPTQEEASKISDAIIAHVEERAGELNKNASLEAIFEVVGSQPVIVKKDISVGMGMVYGAVAGFAIFLFLTALATALRKPEGSDQNHQT